MKKQISPRTQHTPGPWQLDSSCNTKVVTGYDADGDHELVAECGFPANARLIAAAPDLLEALEMLLESEESTLGDGGSILGDDYRMTARSAIAKARGESV